MFVLFAFTRTLSSVIITLIKCVISVIIRRFGLGMRLPRGWKRLTREQPKTLAAIVRYSKAHADLVPQPNELAEILNITEPAARERISRLRPYFTKRRGSLFVDLDRLCTRKESALLLLTIQSISPKDIEGRVFKSQFSRKLVCKYGDGFADVRLIDRLWSRGIETGYLIEISPQCVRPGELIIYQLEYLKIIST